MEYKKAKIIIENMFRPKDRIAGGLVGILEKDISNNVLLHGKSHVTKAEEMVILIENILKNEELNHEQSKGLGGISELLKKLLGRIKK